MSDSQEGALESYGSCQTRDETTKQGVCCMELRRLDMAQQAVYHRYKLVRLDQKDKTQPLSTIVKEECVEDDKALTVAPVVKLELETRKRLRPNKIKEEIPDKALTVVPVVKLELETRKRLRPIQIKEEIPRKGAELRQISSAHKRKLTRHGGSIDRWSTERYNLAEKVIFETMKEKGTAYDNPITRPDLRNASRKHIGDTGLLDHLLKHIDGKVAPGGTDKFRRCYNTNGIMEYWLESTEKINVQEYGVMDPSKTLSRYKHTGGQVELLQAQITKMKREMQELVSKKQEQDQATEETHKELIKLEGTTREHLMEISSALSSMQDMYTDVVVWKNRMEQHMTEISISMSNLQASKRQTLMIPTHGSWDYWGSLEGGYIPHAGTGDDNLNEIASWLETSDLFKNESEAEIQQPFIGDASSQGVEDPDPKEEMARERDGLEMVLHQRVEEDDNANRTPDSSVTGNSKTDVNNSGVRFQEMLKDLVNWKVNMEERLKEMSSWIAVMHQSK